MEIKEYENGQYAHSGEFDIGNPQEVMQLIIEKAPEIADKLKEGLMRVGLSKKNCANIQTVRMNENGIVLYVANTIPCDANRYDDFSRARMYIFDDGEIHYVFDIIDTRVPINKGVEDVNKDILTQLDSKMGEKVALDKKVFLDKLSKLTMQQKK